MCWDERGCICCTTGDFIGARLGARTRQKLSTSLGPPRRRPTAWPAPGARPSLCQCRCLVSVRASALLLSAIDQRSAISTGRTAAAGWRLVAGADECKWCCSGQTCGARGDWPSLGRSGGETSAPVAGRRCGAGEAVRVRDGAGKVTWSPQGRGRERSQPTAAAGREQDGEESRHISACGGFECDAKVFLH